MAYQIKIGKDLNIDDIDEIYRLVGWGVLRSKAQWEKVISKSTFMVQITDNGKVIGFGRTLDDGDMCMIYDICVHPDYQRQGVGHIIMTEIKKYTDSNDFIRIQLFTSDENKGLIKFYEQFGFTKTGTGLTLIGQRFEK